MSGGIEGPAAGPQGRRAASDAVAGEWPGAACALLALHEAAVRQQGRWLLHEVNLAVSPGERVALVGANGAGKSTLLRALLGTQPLALGRRQAREGLRVAMVFQRPQPLRLSALAHVRLALWLRGRPWRHTAAAARLLLEQVGLAEAGAQRADGLSGGQMQRLALAQALAAEPELLLLDEPTASLDPAAARELEALLAGLGQRGTTLVWASHHLGQVRRLATRVVLLGHGRLLADLPTARMFDAAYTAAHCPAAHAFVQAELGG